MRKQAVTERFLNAFDEPAVFDCGPFNLLKVVQDALLRKVGESGKRTYFDRPKVLIKGYFALKRLKERQIDLPISDWEGKRILAVLPPRFVDVGEGTFAQQYLGNLKQYLPEGEPLLMYLHSVDQPRIAADVEKKMIDRAFGSAPLYREEHVFLDELKACFQRIVEHARFTEEELKHVRVGLDEFWRNYRAMDRFVASFSVKHCLLVPGYYTEFLIAALKKYGVEIIELQHGVITPASHFYCYPEKIKPVVNRALFADRIWTFGSFWKRQLMRGVGYSEAQIDVLGDYFVRNAKAPSDPLKEQAFKATYKDLVLIGTQTKRHEHFNRLIRHLAEQYAANRPTAGIMVKPHPAEDPKLYEIAGAYSNVLVTDASLDYLYPICSVYISMYSNTLFEAARYPGLRIFVLMAEETAELVEGIAESGVAEVLHEREDPLSEETIRKGATDATEYFSPSINGRLMRGLWDS